MFAFNFLMSYDISHTDFSTKDLHMSNATDGELRCFDWNPLGILKVINHFHGLFVCGAQDVTIYLAMTY